MGDSMYRPVRIAAAVAAFALFTGGATAAASAAVTDARSAAAPDLSGVEAARATDAERLAELHVQIAELEQQNSVADDALATAMKNLASAKRARDAARAAAAAAAAAAANQGSGSSSSPSAGGGDDEHEDERDDDEDEDDD
jgi:hypothetical protein